MATLTRKFLTALGIESEKVDEIISAHTDTLEEIKQERDTLKTDHAAAVSERDKLQKRVEALEKTGGDIAKLQKEYDDYKAQVESDRLNAGKTQAVREALRKAGAREQFIDLLLKEVDLEKTEMEGDKLKDAKAVIDPVKAKFGDVFGTVKNRGHEPLNPPTGDPAGMSKADILKIKDPVARQKAIAENLDKFGYQKGE